MEIGRFELKEASLQSVLRKCTFEKRGNGSPTPYGRLTDALRWRSRPMRTICWLAAVTDVAALPWPLIMHVVS